MNKELNAKNREAYHGDDGNNPLCHSEVIYNPASCRGAKATWPSPAIRFKGFTDEWEEKKLWEVVQRVTRKNSKLESTLPLTISAEYGLIDQNDFFDKRIASKDVSGYYLIKKGEFAYNKSTSNEAPWGAIKKLTRYEKGVLSTLYIIFKINDSKKTDSDFLATFYDGERWHSEIQAIAAEGARNHGLLNITVSDFFNTKLTIPQSLEEQQKIGSYFAALDSLIKSEKQKVEQVQALKKYMLQNMFPQKGKTNPNIRFASFTDEWREKKFGDLGTIAMCRRIFKEETSVDEEIPFFKIGTFGSIPDTYISRKLFESYKSKYSYPEKGDILVSVSGTIGRIVEFSGKDEYFQDSNIVWLKHDKSIANVFLKQVYQIVKWNGIEGTTIKRLYNENFLKTKIYVPSLEEQQKIGSYFATLDKTIAEQKSKLEQLKTLKKFMLRNMFV